MKILHFSDMHIGVENYGKTDTETGLSTRLLDFLATYDEVISYAISNNVDLVIFSGDAYKSRDPSQTHQREFAKRIAALSNKGIPIFMLVGNHDTPHVIGRATALDIFNTLEVPNVYTGERMQTYQIQTNDGPIQIVAVPWIRRSTFLARDEARGLSPDQVNIAIQERLARMIRLQADNLDKEIPAVLAGHISVSEATTGSEQSMMLGHDHVLLKSDVALKEFDYVALGHIHKHQILNINPHVVYSGSLQRVDFGEEKDEKGFCIVDLDPTKSEGFRFQDFRFERVNARSFLTITVNISNGDLDPTASITQAISKHHIQDAVVRLKITVPKQLEGHLQDGEIRNALNEAHFVASISKEIIEQPRTRLGSAYSKGLSPKEALRIYLNSRSIPNDRFQVLMQKAEELMEEDVIP